MYEKVTLRSVEPSDADAVARMIRALAAATGEEHKVSSRAQDFARHGFASPPAFRGLLAECNNRAVGLALWCYVFSSWRGEPGAYLQDLYVDDGMRGSGLGRRLLAATAGRAQADGATHLRLSVAITNTAAQNFYAHLGFTYRDDECIYQLSDAAFDTLAARHAAEE